MAFHISDQHFFHSNIIKYCNRPFKDINEMNYFMIEKWNEVVGINDIIYHHGDFCLGGKNNASSILSVLNGYKILIKGNHDKKGKKWFKDIDFDEVHKKPINIGRYVLSHRPIENLEPGIINIHGHIHNYDTNKLNYYNDYYINVCVEATGYKPVWIDIQ